jgi:hypothetical protein
MTGNHYWADGIVAGALLALVIGGLRLYDVLLARVLPTYAPVPLDAAEPVAA